MPELDNELQTRTCRACGKDYNYPVVRNPATRFYCEECVQIPPPVRATFEKYNRRIRDLTRQLDKLEKQLSHPADQSTKES